MWRDHRQASHPLRLQANSKAKPCPEQVPNPNVRTSEHANLGRGAPIVENGPKTITFTTKFQAKCTPGAISESERPNRPIWGEVHKSSEINKKLCFCKQAPKQRRARGNFRITSHPRNVGAQRGATSAQGPPRNVGHKRENIFLYNIVISC